MREPKRDEEKHIIVGFFFFLDFFPLSLYLSRSLAISSCFVVVVVRTCVFVQNWSMVACACRTRALNGMISVGMRINV